MISQAANTDQKMALKSKLQYCVRQSKLEQL